MPLSEEQRLSRLQDSADSLITAEKLITDSLRTSGLIDSNQTFGNYFSYLRDTHNIEDVEITRVIDYLSNCRQFSQSVRIFLQENESDTILQTSRKNAMYSAQRNHMWSLWIHRIIRWTAGAFLLLLLYSLFVFLESKYDFIKIPIRETIMLMK